MKTKSIQTTMVRALALGATAAFPSSWRRGLLTALLTVLGLTAGNATVIFSDNFTDVTTATLNANGWYFNNGNAGGTAWIIADSPQSGSLLQNPGGSAQNSRALRQFTTQTLSVGQSLTLQVDFSLQFTGLTTQYALWLGNSPTTITSNQFGGFPGMDLPSGFTGYNVWGENNGAPGTNKYYNNAQIWELGPAMGAATIMSSTTPSLLALTVTRVETGTEVGWSVNGIQRGSSWLDTNNPLNTFNTVSLFGPGAQPKFDNISVSVIPEPSTFAMLLFGGAFAVWRKRVVRRRSSV
jgi:PEP-CTERM motif